jgi:hypothetical protein
MNFDYVLLPLGLVCLGIPAPVMCSDRVREKLRQPARRHESGIVSLLRSGVNWIDLVRGAAGAWLVQHVFRVAHGGQDDLATTFLIAQLATLFIGVVAQTIWIDRSPRILGPAFFLAGLTLVVSGPLVGGFALVLGFAAALMLRRLSLAFAFVPASLLAFGLLFHQLGLPVLFNAGAFALPAFLAFASGSRIAFARRPVPLRSYADESGPVEFPADSRAREAMVITPDFTASRANIGG